jgi:hypothetical protein
MAVESVAPAADTLARNTERVAVARSPSAVVKAMRCSVLPPMSTSRGLSRPSDSYQLPATSYQPEWLRRSWCGHQVTDPIGDFEPTFRGHGRAGNHSG